jgi:hypothetical protein
MKAPELTRKNVSVHLDTYDRLKAYGLFGDSYTDLIDRILDYAESRGLSPETLRTENKRA